MSVSDEFDHEARIRAVEQRISEHEARCEERYKYILSGAENLQVAIDKLINIITKRFDYLLLALVVLSVSMAIGPDIALRLFGPGK